MPSDDLDAARADYDADLERFDFLDGNQLHYLGNLDRVDDPETDGLECDADT